MLEENKRMRREDQAAISTKKKIAPTGTSMAEMNQVFLICFFLFFFSGQLSYAKCVSLKQTINNEFSSCLITMDGVSKKYDKGDITEQECVDFCLRLESSQDPSKSNCSPVVKEDNLTRQCKSFLALMKKMPDGHSVQNLDPRHSHSQPSSREMILDLTGSRHGFGDITGPLWTLLDLKKVYPDDHFSVVIDARGRQITSELFDGESISNLETKLGVTFVDQEKVRQIKKADYLFQFFYSARNIHQLTDLSFTDNHTVAIIGDHMHGPRLDEVRKGDSSIYLKPPGIGADRSGVVNNPDVNPFVGKTIQQRRVTTAKLFQGSFLEKILNAKVHSNAKIGFAYGAHNEVESAKDLAGCIGQTTKFVKEVTSEYASKAPVLIFSANSKSHFKQVLADSSNVLELGELERLPALKNEVYIVPLGDVSSKQFAGLMASSDIPVLVEGNSAISSALRMSVPFIMYRSFWNSPQIKNIVDLEHRYLHSNSFEDVYNKGVIPAFEEFVKLRKGEGFYKALSVRVPDYSTKVVNLVDMVEQIKEINSQKISSEERGQKYQTLSSEVYEKTKDEVLEYSLIFDAHNRKLVPDSVFKLSQKQFLDRCVKSNQDKITQSEKASKCLKAMETLESRFVPNQRNFHLWIPPFERIQ